MKITHAYHFLILIFILGVGALTFYSVAGSRMLQLLTGVVTAIGYVAWGLLHHAMQGDLHKKIVIEYLLIGATAVVLLFMVLQT